MSFKVEKETDWTNTNEIYERVVNDRVLRLRHEVMEEFRKLGFHIYTSSGFLHEATITMAYEINSTSNDEEAKRRIRPIVKKLTRGWDDEVEFPVWELVLFPNNPRETTTLKGPEGGKVMTNIYKPEELIYIFGQSVGSELKRRLAILTSRQQGVFILRRGFDRNGKLQSYQFVGDIFGVSRERARQIYFRAIIKLKKGFGTDLILEIPLWGCLCGKYYGIRCKGIKCDKCGGDVVQQGSSSQPFLLER